VIRAGTLGACVAALALAAGCSTTSGGPRGGGEGPATVPASEVLARLEQIASGPAVLGVEVSAGCVDLSFGPRGAARSGRVLLGAGRARLRLRGEDERPEVDRTEASSGTLDPEA